MPATVPAARQLPQFLPDVALMLSVGLMLGLLTLGRASVAGFLIGAPVLLGMFNAYNWVLRRNQNLKRGLLLGVLMGTLVGGFGAWAGGSIVDVWSGVKSGTLLGLGLGAMVGLVSRVAHDDQDAVLTKAFLFVGSIGLGAGLGAGVGLLTGFILGGIAQSWAGTFLALMAGGVVGAYLGSYYHQVRWVLFGVSLAVAVTAVSIWLGGAFAGLVLGSIAGSFAPILLVASIGAAGGLLARGLRAMVVEALEAPTEMLEQGASSYLLPAVITGAVVGTSATGVDALVILSAAFGLMGLLYGAMADVNGRPGSVVTLRSLVEMAMIGSDEWSVGSILSFLGGENWRKALLGGVVGAFLGLLGALLGWLTAKSIVNVLVAL